MQITLRSSKLLLVVFALLFSFVVLQAQPPKATSATSNIIGVDVSAGNTGAYPSMKLNASGFPVIAYYATEDKDLRIATCNNAQCSNPTISTIDSNGEVGFGASLALNAAGYPIISYLSYTDHVIKVAVCGNVLCTSGNTITTLQPVSLQANYTSLVLNSSGNPVISYPGSTLTIAICGNATCTSGNVIKSFPGVFVNATAIKLNSLGNPVVSYNGNGLVVLVCGDPVCGSGNTVSTVDDTDALAGDSNVSLALNSSGNPVIGYGGYNSQQARVAVCGNATCSSSNTLTTLDASSAVGYFAALGLNQNGYPALSYLDYSHETLKLAVCGNVTCSSGNSVVTLGDVGHNGGQSSVAFNNNGFPIIAHTNLTTKSLTLALCGDTICSNKTFQVVDARHDVGVNSSMAINANGNPIVGYTDLANGDLKLAICGDTLCNSKTIRTLDSVGAVGASPSLVLTSNGYPIIAHIDWEFNNRVKLEVCADQSCLNHSSTTVETVSGTVYRASLSLNANSLPVISYIQNTASGQGELKLVVCADITCTNKTITSLDSSGGGYNVKLLMNAAGHPVISYISKTDTGDFLKLLVCADANCTSSTITTIQTPASSYYMDALSMVFNPAGNPVISFLSGSDQNLRLVVCGDPLCGSKTVTIVDHPGYGGAYSSLGLRPNGNSVISYYDPINSALKVAVCGNATCSSGNALFIADNSADIGLYPELRYGQTDVFLSATMT